MSYPNSPYHPGPPVVSQEVNRAATWSMVLAFVFPPAGALLAHRALGEIKRTGQRGRDRALIGVILSYVFIVVIVAALLAWAIIPGDAGTPARPPSASPAPATTTTTTPRPGPAMVQRDQLAGLLLSVDDIKRIANAPNQYTVEERTTVDGTEGMVATPPECLPALFSGLDSLYSRSDARATVARELNTTVRTGIVGMVERVAIFDSGLAATGMMQQIVGGWQRCAGKTVTVVINNGQPNLYDLGQVTKVGTSPTIYRIRSTFQNSAPGFANYRIVVAKANILLDMGMYGYDIGTGPQDLAAAILAKIPG